MKKLKKCFIQDPWFHFKVPQVSSYLVRAKVERTVGSFKVNKSRCQVCRNVNETDTFTSTMTKQTYKIIHKFNCSDKCLIYLLTCKKCLIQYVVKVGFRCEWNNYTKIILEIMIVINHACRDIYMDIIQMLITVCFWNMSQ